MTAWRPTASAESLQHRARILGRIRAFFAARGVVEIQTPLLTESGVTDVHIEGVATESPAGWLRTSPEYFHKRLLAAGFGDLYELGTVFRRDEAGRNHQPEFTLLEWYRVGWDWRSLANEAVELIAHCLDIHPDQRPVRWLSWNDCFREYLDIDALAARVDELDTLADDAPDGLPRDGLLDWLFATRIQPRFNADGMTIVHDYPASQAALARLSEENPAVAERFEVFLGTSELANGYRELCDPAEQLQRFLRDNRIRRQNGQLEMPVDEKLLAALDEGLPECSGVALGFDRLLMAARGADSIDQGVAFAHQPTF